MGVRSRRVRRQSVRWLRSVHVNTYPRFRYGRWESVCEHWRSPPGTQLAFEF